MNSRNSCIYVIMCFMLFFPLIGIIASLVGQSPMGVFILFGEFTPMFACRFTLVYPDAGIIKFIIAIIAYVLLYLGFIIISIPKFRYTTSKRIIGKAFMLVAILMDIIYSIILAISNSSIPIGIAFIILDIVLIVLVFLFNINVTE